MEVINKKLKTMNTKDKKYKEFIKLNDRLNYLYKELRNLPLIKLDVPYQRGWEISYDLRQDIKNREDSDIILEALNIGYSNFFTKDVNIVRAIRRKQPLIKTNKTGTVTVDHFYPKINYLRDYQFIILDKVNKYFKFSEYDEYYIKYKIKRYFCLVPNYWIVLKVKPYMITHTRQKGGELEQEHEYLHKKLWCSGEFENLTTHYGSSYPAYKDRVKVRDKISKFKHGIIDDIYNEKIPRCYDY